MSINDKSAPRLHFRDVTAPGGNLGQYVIATHPSANTVTLTGASLEVNEMFDKVVEIVLNGIAEYAIVASNTSDTLVFDDDLDAADVSGKTLTILHTIALRDEELDTIIAIDSSLGAIAGILPASSYYNQRKYAHLYIELSGDYICPLVCRGTDRQLGAKNGYIQFRGEGARLHAHMFGTPHWDIIQAYGIKRYATGYWDAADSITAVDFSNLVAAKVGANINTDYASRFVAIEEDGVQGIMYTSLIPNFFSGRINAIIEKTGAGSDASIGFAKYTKATDTLVLLDTRISSTVFGGGDGVQVIHVMAPIQFSFGDKLFVVASRATGVFTINAGSSVEVVEM